MLRCAGGAAAMQGVTPSSNALYDGVPLEPPPSIRQGFGRLDLANSLPLAGAAAPHSMQVSPEQSKCNHSFCNHAVTSAALLPSGTNISWSAILLSNIGRDHILVFSRHFANRNAPESDPV